LMAWLYGYRFHRGLKYSRIPKRAILGRDWAACNL
jgi:hypothetical protein